MDQRIKIIARDFEGKFVFEMNVEAPIPYPYLFFQDRLFVMSRDEPNVLLERSYCVFKNSEPPKPRLREAKDSQRPH